MEKLLFLPRTCVTGAARMGNYGVDGECVRNEGMDLTKRCLPKTIGACEAVVTTNVPLPSSLGLICLLDFILTKLFLLLSQI